MNADTTTPADELVRKLNPKRFDGISGKMSAIVGYVLNQDWTEPRIVEMCVTSDGIVMAGVEGDVGLNHLLGRAADLDDNWNRLLDVAGLTFQERLAADTLFRARIKRW